MPERMDGSAGRRGVLVRQLGGSSLASIDRVRAVADDLVRKRAEGFELDLKLWAGLWMIDHNPDGSPAA